jgi:hypothetical protein
MVGIFKLHMLEAGYDNIRGSPNFQKTIGLPRIPSSFIADCDVLHSPYGFGRFPRNVAAN